MAIKFPLSCCVFYASKWLFIFPRFQSQHANQKEMAAVPEELPGLDPKLTVGMPNKNPAMLQMFLFQSIKNWMGPNPNGPYQVSCNRAIRYSGFFQGPFRNSPPAGDFLDPRLGEIWRFHVDLSEVVLIAEIGRLPFSGSRTIHGTNGIFTYIWLIFYGKCR